MGRCIATSLLLQNGQDLKIGEKVVEHRARKYGKTKFGVERFINGFLDLASITFVGRYGKRPMHFLDFSALFFLIG